MLNVALCRNDTRDFDQTSNRYHPFYSASKGTGPGPGPVGIDNKLENFGKKTWSLETLGNAGKCEKM